MSSRSSNMLSPKFPYSQNGFAARHGSMLDYSRGGDEPQLLDNFPNAAAAYSLRKIKAGVTIVVRVRRSSDNAEQDFTADDITGGALAAFCGAGDGFATRWYDQSGFDRHITQGTALNQPKIYDSGSLVMKGSNPAMDTYHNGNFSRFGSLDLSGESYTNATALCVYEITASSVNTSLWDFYGVNPTASLHPFGSNGYYYDTFFVTNRSDFLTVSFSTPDYLVYWIQNVAGNTAGYVNNILAGTASQTFSMPAGATDIPTQANGIQGTLQEVIIWGEDKSADRGAIQSDINAYYSIY